MEITEIMLSRAKGVLAGQIAGDSLGSLAEFQPACEIRKAYPKGVSHLVDGGVWGHAAGQPTDDSEMALMLARSIAEHGAFLKEEVAKRYRYWIGTNPDDYGHTTAQALIYGSPVEESQANGALMRVSPIGIFAACRSTDEAEKYAMEDASITHPNRICLEASALFAETIAYAVRTGAGPCESFEFLSFSSEKFSEGIREIVASSERLPVDFMKNMGWVRIALQNALYYLRNAISPEDAVIATVMSGGDTDTNAAICGALTGACWGIEAFPEQWIKSIRACTPERIRQKARRPRPAVFSPSDFEELAEKLLSAGANL